MSDSPNPNYKYDPWDPCRMAGERLFAEPCQNCGHSADAHIGTPSGCCYPVYDYEPGRGDSEVAIPESERECGCDHFVGVESGCYVDKHEPGGCPKCKEERERDNKG